MKIRADFIIPILVMVVILFVLAMIIACHSSDKEWLKANLTYIIPPMIYVLGLICGYINGYNIAKDTFNKKD